MALPTLLEIVPPDAPVRAEVSVPGSKSITNRALVLGALAQGVVGIEGALWSEDTRVMVEAMDRLGFEVSVQADPSEGGNRRIRIRGQDVRIPRGGSRDCPLELAVGNAGTAARFLAALVCLGRGHYRLDGTPRMRERPQSGLFAALRALGHGVEAERDRLPAVIEARGPRAGSCSVSIVESSQFASALLLASRHGRWRIDVEGENAEESSYVAMTRSLMTVFPWKGGSFAVEPDASSGSYFVGAAHLFRSRWGNRASLSVRNWPAS